jgi:hypothetical protein
VGDRPSFLTAADLDAMTPDQRAAALRERLVTDLDDLRPEFRERVVEKALLLERTLPGRPMS